MEKISYLLLLGLLLVAPSCEPALPDSAGLVRQTRAQHRLTCSLDSLRREATHLWDAVNRELAASLPTDMPADERRNMLQVRNAGLIQMFMVFDSFPATLQALVEDAGIRDSLIGAEMRRKQDTLLRYERRVDSLLLHLQKQEPAKYLTEIKKLQELLGKPCD